MGMVVHPDFASSRLFTTCQTHEEGGQPDDVRLVTWRLSADGSSAERVKDLLTGLPISSGPAQRLPTDDRGRRGPRRRNR